MFVFVAGREQATGVEVAAGGQTTVSVSPPSVTYCFNDVTPPGGELKTGMQLP